MILLALARSLWTYIVLLILACGALGGLWRHAAAEAGRAERECDARRLEAVNAALREQAQAWESVYSAQQEAVTRMAAEAGVAAATAREWRRRYELAKQTPACKRWAEEAIQCPVE